MKNKEHGFSTDGQVVNFSEDYERVSEQEYIYLLEKKMMEEQQYWEYVNRKPAQIIVINKDKINSNDEQTINTNVLPF